MKHNNSKELSRAKRYYKSNRFAYIDILEEISRKVYIKTIKRCESITEFLNSRYAKKLKNTTVPFRSKKVQMDQHRKNKRSRVKAKQQIIKDILEWDDRYTDDLTCFDCKFYIQEPEPYCVKHKQLCYWDDCICSNFKEQYIN